MERKEFHFIDGTRGDVYRCLLLAMKADPPLLAFKYDEMLRRTQALCKGASPAGSSVAQIPPWEWTLANKGSSGMA
jgi:hypothetical protein